MVTLHRRSRVVLSLLSGHASAADPIMQNQALTMIYEESNRIKRQNAVSAHLRTNLPRDPANSPTLSINTHHKADSRRKRTLRVPKAAPIEPSLWRSRRNLQPRKWGFAKETCCGGQQ
jgi:hypothetical protein